MFESIQLALADLADKLSPYAIYFLALPVIYIGIVNVLKLQIPLRSDLFWTDNVKQVTIRTGIATVVFGALVGFFLQSVFRSVYSLLLIPLSILTITIILMGGYIFTLYLIYVRRQWK